MKYLVVSGGTKGIGRAVADLFAQQGFSVAVCARTAADLRDMEADYRKRFPAAAFIGVQTDVRDPKALKDFARQALEAWPRIDVLVNNAGIFEPGQIHLEPAGQLERLVETNLYSAYHLTRALLPRMLEQGQAHIFNMCSIASLQAYTNGGAYSISKFALLGFSKNLREELKDKGIRVTAVMPGATWSDSWKGANQPANRLMQAHDIALALWSAWSMSPAAVVEDIVIRPQLGDL